MITGTYSRSSRVQALFLAAATGVVTLCPLPQAKAQFPLQPNEAVATFASFANSSSYVVGVYDIRDPDCNGVPVPTCTDASQTPPCITNWPAPQYNNEMPNPTNNAADVWNVANLGAIFGVELDDEPSPNIYVSSTSLFSASSPSGNVMKIDGTTGAISLFATLPNSGQGLGNLTYDRRTRQFYVTDHEDGKIYRLDYSGAIIDSFDPFGADDGTSGFAPLGERLWAIEVHPIEGRLYFGRWEEDGGAPGTPNSIWSVDLAADGSFAGAEMLEVTIPPVSGSCTTTHPAADLAFSSAGNMLIGTRGMSTDTLTLPHASTDLQYAGGHLAWALTTQFDVGLFISGCGRANSAGGVDYADCVPNDACNPGELAVFMSDAIDLNPNNIYGLQITPVATGSLLDSYFIDLDNDTTSQDKTALGDVDVVRFCSQPPIGTGACCIDATATCIDALSQTECEQQGGRYAGDGFTCVTAVFDPPCGQVQELPCCFADGTCGSVTSAGACTGAGGTLLAPGAACTAPEACCLPDETCIEVDPLCCEASGGTPQGAGSTCTDSLCVTTQPVPTVSSWGLAILTLLLLAGAKLVLRNRREAA